MKVKCHVLKSDVNVTLTPDEIWELILICEGDKVFNRQCMRECTPGSQSYEDYKRMAESAERLQQKFIDIRNQGSIEEVNV